LVGTVSQPFLMASIRKNKKPSCDGIKKKWENGEKDITATK
jgi:hypothetical protein